MGIAAMGFSGADLPPRNKSTLYSDGMAQKAVSNHRRETLQALAVSQLGNSLAVRTSLPDNESDLMHCTLLLLRLGRPADALSKMMASATQRGLTVVLTPADLSSSRDAALACRSDFLIASASELESLTDMPVHCFAQIEEAAKSLLQKGLRNLIITLGERGCLWMRHGKTRHVAAYKVNAVDTRGAGDAFVGCFAHYYAKDGDVLNALEHASLYAACCVTRAGWQDSYPSLAEFQVFRP